MRKISFLVEIWIIWKEWNYRCFEGKSSSFGDSNREGETLSGFLGLCSPSFSRHSINLIMFNRGERWLCIDFDFLIFLFGCKLVSISICTGYAYINKCYH